MTTLPRFLAFDEVLFLHADLIARYGGGLGLRSPRLLASAIEQPRAMFEGRFLHRDLEEMAVAYLFHLVGNHPFLDGNKRVGAAAAVVFLDLNAAPILADQEGLCAITLAVAQGRAVKAEVVAFLRSRRR